MKPILICTLLAFTFSCCNILHAQQKLTPKQDSIITKHLKNGAWKCHYFSKEYDRHIDEAIAADSTIAYLWQQKGMPYFKKQKYEVGMRSLDRAVALDSKWLDYRAFMKCIFVRNYSDALVDFEACIKRDPNGYVMDHPYSFYVAICHLQLNEYKKAFELLNTRVSRVEKEKGEIWIHPNELFYLGISQYELGEYTNAIQSFDRALALYPEFSDALFYKAKCYESSDMKDAAEITMIKAREYFEKGYTINEDNAVYEQLPYQVNWKLHRKK